MIDIGQVYHFPQKQPFTSITILDVARYLLTYESMTHKKLQKLCYYSYVWYLIFHHKPLFTNRFEAWIHGPVDPVLYDFCQSSGWRPMTKVTETILFPKEVEEVLWEVFEAYGYLDGFQLEALTQSEFPWKKARGDLAAHEPSHNKIMDQDIIHYYSKLLD